MKRTIDRFLPSEGFAEAMEQEVWPLLDSCLTEMMIEGKDAAPIHARFYAKEGSTHVVCISHGFTEFADKYGEVIYMFLNFGYSVAICEHRGHGFSAREPENLCKVHIDTYDTYVEDYHCFVEEVKKAFPGQKLFLYAHSMGGAIGALYLEAYPEDFTCAVMSSPMMEVSSNGVPVGLCLAYGKVMGARGKGMDYLGDQNQDFKGTEPFEKSVYDDYERFKYWKEWRFRDEYLQTSGGTIEWSMASLAAAPRAVKAAKNIHIPVLLCQAGKDTMVLPGGQLKFVGDLEFGKIRIFETSKHEISNSTPEIRKTFWRTVLGWFGMHE